MTDQPKKMNVVQLTFIVTVNMMGSGIIMLPTNMAKVGAISLLSWVVTAVGSMAIAYGFAQAGILNQRAGGMAAYAEDAYGKPGYFQVFFLYFLSLAIANVAVASSALGYLAAFFPVLTSSPVATCIGVIALLWITTAANFGGPKVTGRIGSITVWGVILPVGFMSIAGWFWFHPSIFSAAWNPQGLRLIDGMGSSIALTLWAFLGMESAVQNSSAVENPKRDVPLACLFGTLGAAVIYVLSTTAIQGIVPNEELAKSTGPFGLAFAHMFSPVIGSIVMALAAMACVGSLLGWQFTLAQTAKDAADSNMFPSIFSKASHNGAPVPGMIIMGVVQSLMALSTISPNLSEQFAALVNLAVVTNVVPYIVSLSALFVMMRDAGTEPAVYRRNAIVAVIAMAYSIYALYASGKDAVLGGMLVMAIGYVIYGFIAPRLSLLGAKARKPAIAAASIIAFAVLCAPAPRPAHAAGANTVQSGALARIKQTGKINIGYLDAASPFVYRDNAGRAVGFLAGMCQGVADQVKGSLGLPDLTVNWTQISFDDRYRALQDHRIDVLCGDPETLTGRQFISYSVPVYPGGVGALMRTDASRGLKELLSGDIQPHGPIWRASPAQLLNSQTFSAVKGTPTERWLRDRVNEFKLTAHVVYVSSYEEGVRQVLDRKINVFFAERQILQDAVKRSTASDDLLVLQRRFTIVPVSLGVARDDEDMRLFVDQALSKMYLSGDYRGLFVKWFGEPDEATKNFYRMAVVPE
ncbi:putrescine-ornithine antiporter [Paraburkholderia caribensis]|uniref:Putrescine transporter n=1 Tax=Paraburkholderia caribensis TaxID=75105 RepID=A0A9Q6WQE0_9BURK|nr:putrescine-ornithine antiporter [Paraburkholderia caribensis]MCO4879281.1 putrescine-ornithine antiporter [Paraburkholderia caribensis]PTB27422.1 putrescine-ornithine antiporter [Paraburkholderia caribensis]QLB67053.1 putrescine-ornithine antiporter [Paraburkholderia caribensis]